jgi:hypothetical protein
VCVEKVVEKINNSEWDSKREGVRDDEEVVGMGDNW